MKKPKLKPGDIVRVPGERGTSKIRSIMESRHAALLDKQIGGFRNWNLDEIRLVKRGKQKDLKNLPGPINLRRYRRSRIEAVT